MLESRLLMAPKESITSDSEATKTKTDFQKNIESAKILPAPRAIQQSYYCILQKHKKIVPENLNQLSVPRELYVQNMFKVAVLPLSNFYWNDLRGKALRFVEKNGSPHKTTTVFLVKEQTKFWTTQENKEYLSHSRWEVRVRKISSCVTRP